MQNPDRDYLLIKLSDFVRLTDNIRTTLMSARRQLGTLMGAREEWAQYCGPLGEDECETGGIIFDIGSLQRALENGMLTLGETDPHFNHSLDALSSIGARAFDIERIVRDRFDMGERDEDEGRNSDPPSDRPNYDTRAGELEDALRSVGVVPRREYSDEDEIDETEEADPYPAVLPEVEVCWVGDKRIPMRIMNGDPNRFNYMKEQLEHESRPAFNAPPERAIRRLD